MQQNSMAKGYMAMKRKLIEKGLSEQEAADRASRIWDDDNPDSEASEASNYAEEKNINPYSTYKKRNL